MRYVPRPDCQIPSLAEIYEKHIQGGPGRFVEIGAYDGVSVSNTVFLAEAGWTGVYAEPHPEYAARCRDNHKASPNIQVCQTAIAHYVGEAKLYTVGECSSLVLDKSTRDWGAKEDTYTTVPVTTLNRLLEALNWQPDFDLLVIDVEQAEFWVLAGFDVQKWQPKMVIIEAHELDPAPERNYKALPITNYMTNDGYRKIYTDHINSIFIRDF